MANFISEPVLVGFKAGIAVVIIVDQLPKILGIHFTKGSFLHNVQAIGVGLSDASMPTLAVGVSRRSSASLSSKSSGRSWPAPLIVVALAIAGVALFELQSQRHRAGRRDSAGLPAFSVPELALANQLWPAALGIALMSFTETAAVGRAFAQQRRAAAAAQCRAVRDRRWRTRLGAFLGSMPGGGGMRRPRSIA